MSADLTAVAPAEPGEKATTEKAAAKSKTLGVAKAKSKAGRSNVRMLTRVAAGHQGDVVKEVGEGNTGTGFILKKKDATEGKNYEALFAEAGDPMQSWTPMYGGQTTDDTGQEYLRLQNLTSPDYVGAYVLDCKLGVRTFLEKEARNETLREDLYKKAKALAPSMLTDEENERGSITKYRWMTIHDSQTTTIKEGWRIDGCAGATSITKAELQKNKNREAVIKFLSTTYMDLVCPGDLSVTTEQSIPYQVATTIVEKLTKMRSDFEASPFFKSREFIGTSLLLIADKKGKVGVNMIDLAKTWEVPEELRATFDHRKPWVLGNHEDGCLFGLDNMIECWKAVQEEIANQKKQFILEEEEDVGAVPKDAELKGVAAGNGETPAVDIKEDPKPGAKAEPPKDEPKAPEPPKDEPKAPEPPKVEEKKPDPPAAPVAAEKPKKKMCCFG